MKRRNQWAEFEEVMKSTVINIYHFFMFVFFFPKRSVHMAHIFAGFVAVNFLSDCKIFKGKFSDFLLINIVNVIGMRLKNDKEKLNVE